MHSQARVSTCGAPTAGRKTSRTRLATPARPPRARPPPPPVRASTIARPRVHAPVDSHAQPRVRAAQSRNRAHRVSACAAQGATRELGLRAASDPARHRALARAFGASLRRCLARSFGASGAFLVLVGLVISGKPVGLRCLTGVSPVGPAFGHSRNRRRKMVKSLALRK